jgi:hypothetical protein
MEYVGPWKFLKITANGCSFEIPPASIVDNTWVEVSANDYPWQEVKDAINEARATVWNADFMKAYKREREGEIVNSYHEWKLSDEQFQQILDAVPDNIREALIELDDYNKGNTC